jgi:hypothetical protein
MTPEKAIERLDHAIKKYGSRPEFIIMASRLIMELHAIGRITFREGVLHSKYLLLDKEVIVNEEQSLSDFDYRLPILLI